LRLIELPPYTFELWHLLIATGLGVLGAILGTFFKLVTLGTRRLAAPLADRPVVRCTIAGLALGLLGMALPLTLFLGTEGLVEVTDDPLVLGTGLVLASVLFKLVATSTALSFGFVGGPVFPLLFAGGGMGAVIHDVSPDIPIGLAVTSMMVAVPASVIPIPFSLATLTVLIAGIGPTEASGVFAAAIVALIAGRLIESAIRRPGASGVGTESHADE
jgi:H+/Cl- antiporter ClcA